jgi:hypothetical protein
VVGRRLPFRDLLPVVRHALYSAAIVFVVEIVLLIVMATGAAYPYAYYLSGDAETAELAATLWKTMDWTYILFVVSVQFATILLATIPWFYLLSARSSSIRVFM